MTWVRRLGIDAMSGGSVNTATPASAQSDAADRRRMPTAASAGEYVIAVCRRSRESAPEQSMAPRNPEGTTIIPLQR